ncbi:MAG: hypothetical protein LC731_01330 [Acidobacteria bacterium]|nr:hypothetical protein [Acidobacteriota bacterium]
MEESAEKEEQKVEVPNCPTCHEPKFTKRYVRGEPNSICANGHNWPQFQAPKRDAPTDERYEVYRVIHGKEVMLPEKEFRRLSQGDWDFSNNDAQPKS